MSEPTLDVVGIGNALVDVISSESHEFIAAQGLVPGSMNLIDEARWAELYGAMGVGTEVSGGSGVNTTVGVASLGGKAHYLGRVKADQLGTVFAHDIRAAGVGYTTRLAEDGPSTGCCLVLVTPDDGQRTMNTYLGASSLFGVTDVDADVVRSAQNLYLEGYLFDPPAAQEAFKFAASIAHEAGRRVSLTLSDPFCVDRHREAFLGLLETHIDLVFANESELCSLYETDDFETALRSIGDQVPLAAVTRSEKGSVILAGAERVVVPAAPVDVVDTTGAGDLYAAGFLYGLSTGRNLETCGLIASVAAAEVISHIGPRPTVPLNGLINHL
ncbi:MAG: adenosine kinase [Actinobacteria bacterium]|nr:adenosine kinase [Actinomycetota bacterium]